MRQLTAAILNYMNLFIPGSNEYQITLVAEENKEGVTELRGANCTLLKS
jgi:hypothetical protein